MVQKTYATLKRLYANRNALTSHVEKTLCESLVTSIIGYCDLAFYPLFQKNVFSKLKILIDVIFII